MRLANNLLFYWHELFACRAALCRPRHPPWALSSSQRKQGVWPGGSAVVGMSSLHATATSYSIRHFWVRAWRRCANQERRPARPDLLEGGKGLVPLRVALSPLHLLNAPPRTPRRPMAGHIKKVCPSGRLIIAPIGLLRRAWLQPRQKARLQNRFQSNNNRFKLLLQQPSLLQLRLMILTKQGCEECTQDTLLLQ